MWQSRIARDVRVLVVPPTQGCVARLELVAHDVGTRVVSTCLTEKRSKSIEDGSDEAGGEASLRPIRASAEAANEGQRAIEVCVYVPSRTISDLKFTVREYLACHSF